MSEPIRVGDLVQVVRGHVCDLGNIFAVAEINTQNLAVICSDCGNREEIAAPFCRDGTIGARGGRKGAPLPWLRRIPPLTELNEAEHKEELHA